MLASNRSLVASLHRHCSSLLAYEQPAMCSFGAIRARSWRGWSLVAFSSSSHGNNALEHQVKADGKIESPGVVKELSDKPDTCTGDELHYIEAAGGKWRLAMWRYRPATSAPPRNHPLLLLSGVATNAIGFDLDPSVSFARYMAAQGFDTWILEMRAAGLSIKKAEDSENRTAAATVGKQTEKLNDLEAEIEKLESLEEADDKDVERNQENGSFSSQEQSGDESPSRGEISKTASQLSATISELSDRLRSVVNEGQSRVLSARLAEQLSTVLEDAQLSHRYQEIKDRLMKLLQERKSIAFTSQLNDLNSRLTKMLEEAQVSVASVKQLQTKLTSTVEEFQKFLEFIVDFDWDFDHYVEEDVPAAMDYVLKLCKPKDGKLLAAGHSMGGIVLYALLASRGKNSGLAGVVTIASSLDYSFSKSSLHMLLPLADPAQLLNVPVVPLGAIMQAVYPLIAKPPYALAWLGYNVSAKGMMDPDLYKKLVLNNFCTVPAKLILQLKTAFEPGGLKNRDGTKSYRDSLAKTNAPVLAIAGNADLVCPPSAVLDTAATLPVEQGKYVVFGDTNKHYGHYDLLVARSAKNEIFPVILQFLEKHDVIKED